MAMRCPRCRAIAKTRTSVELSLLVRRSYHQCQNMLCGYCFTSMTEIDGSLNQTQPAPVNGAVIHFIFMATNLDRVRFSLKY